MRIALVNGPNLQLLGTREPEVYGSTTLDEVAALVGEEARSLGVEIEAFQSNHEGAILDYVAEVAERVSGFLVNAGALTHTSIGLRDALVGVGRPFVEVHLSNTQAREHFRHRSYLAPHAVGVVAGFGPLSYLLGLRGLVAHLERGATGSASI